jgi:hypothetical protein
MPFDRHENLLKRLEQVRQKKKESKNESYNFLYDPLAEEKVGAQKALRELIQLNTEVTLLCAQTGAVVERIANANEVGEKMTKEVRRLDVIQSRLGECLEQSGLLLNLRNNLNGARQAMQIRNYSEAATFLNQLKHIEKLLPINTADKLRMDDIEKDLKAVVENCFAEGLRDLDKQKLERYAPIFHAVGKEYEERGFQQLLTFIKTNLSQKISRLMTGSYSIKELINHLKIVFNEIAAIIQEYDRLIQTSFSGISGPTRIITELYSIGENAAVNILNSYIKQRNFADRMNKANEEADFGRKSSTSPVSHGSSNPIGRAEEEIELLNEQLNEIALIIQHTQTYERFMRSKIIPLENGSLKNETGRSSITVPWCNANDLSKTVQEVAGYYCYFENDLLNKSARKAFQWEEIRMQTSTKVSIVDGVVGTFPVSSAIDEIFYVSRNSGLRALATGHVDCAAGAINFISSLLRDFLGDTMRYRIRGMNAHFKIDGSETNPFVPNQLRDQMQQQVQQHFAKLSKNIGTTTQLDQKRGQRELSPDVVMNSLEVTVDYVSQMKRQFEEELDQDFPEIPAQISTCLNGLDESSSEIRQLLEACRKKMCKLLEPKLISYFENLFSTNPKKRIQYELTEQMFTFYEANDPFAHQFVSHTRELIMTFRQSLSPTNFSSFVELVCITTIDLLEKWFNSKDIRVNQLGALQFDKDIRVLSTFFSEFCDCRLHFANLTQISMILNVDSPLDVLDVYGRKSRGIEWQLDGARVKMVLSRRVEFSDSAINQLKLPLFPTLSLQK